MYHLPKFFGILFGQMLQLTLTDGLHSGRLLTSTTFIEETIKKHHFFPLHARFVPATYLSYLFYASGR